MEPWGEQPIPEVENLVALIQSYGIPDIYFYGIDEAQGAELTAQRPQWEAIRAAGGKMFAAVDYGEDAFDLVGDILDLAVFNNTVNSGNPPSTQEAAKWHSVGHQIVSYGNPQVGEEKPETYRRNFGLLLWQADY